MFNSRIYSNDGTVSFTNSELRSRSKGRYKKPPQISESNLDTDRLEVRGIKDDQRMNRAVFSMKPLNTHTIIDSSTCNKRKDDKEEYCMLHQKFARVRNMNDLICSQQLDNQISQFNKNKLRNEFEKSIEGFHKSIDPRVCFDEELEESHENDDYKELHTQEHKESLRQSDIMKLRKEREENLKKNYKNYLEKNVKVDLQSNNKNELRKNYESEHVMPQRKAQREIQRNNLQRDSRESFTQDFANTADEIYLLSIRSDIESILRILENVECFNIYSSYWKDLRKNLERNRWNINILPVNDNDIAYSLNKGQELNFKTKDSECFLPMKIMIYVLCHELSHVACTNEKDHTETFSKIMWLIECAAFMAGLLKPCQIPINNIMFSEQSVVSRSIVRDELIIGFMYLRKSNKNIDYIEAAISYLKHLF